jgi:hypothetical protein
MIPTCQILFVYQKWYPLVKLYSEEFIIIIIIIITTTINTIYIYANCFPSNCAFIVLIFLWSVVKFPNQPLCLKIWIHSSYVTHF